MFPMTSFHIVKRACEKWGENGGTRHGAALAYYAVFSIAPLLLVAVYTAGVIFGEDAAKGEVHKHLNAMMGKEVAVNVEDMVKQAAEPQAAGWTPTISVALLIVGALGAFLHVRGTLCTIWKLDPPRGNTWLGMILDYTLSLVMVFVTASLLLFSLACGLAVPILQKQMRERLADEEHYWHWFEIGTAYFFLTILFAMSYRRKSPEGHVKP